MEVPTAVLSESLIPTTRHTHAMSKLILFGGKGGVGKTTLAAAASIWTARHGFKTLVISSDPAHSISDSFEVKIGPEPTPIKGVENLYGLEIDPSNELEKKMPSIKKSLRSPFEMLGFGDLEMDATDLMFPGLDEALAFDALLTYLEDPGFDLIIFDTAPTGHTMRFLSLPGLLDSWLMKILRMRKRINAVKNIFRSEKDETIEEIQQFKRRIEHIKRIISDPKLSSFYIVLIPEKLAFEETKRAMNILQGYRIPVHGLLINNVFPEEEGCAFCSARREVQEQYIKEIGEYVTTEHPNISIATQPLLPVEVKGTRALTKVGENVFGKQILLSLTHALKIKKKGPVIRVSLYLPQAFLKDIGLSADKNTLLIDINGLMNRVELDEDIEDKKISATFKDDVLHVTIE